MYLRNLYRLSFPPSPSDLFNRHRPRENNHFSANTRSRFFGNVNALLFLYFALILTRPWFVDDISKKEKIGQVMITV